MVVVRLVTLNGFEVGRVILRSKVSFISNKLSSFIVMLNTLSIFPAIKVMLSGSKMKSLPSKQNTKGHDAALLHACKYICTYSTCMHA